MKVYYKTHCNGFAWAWKQSARLNVWGIVKTRAEMERRAARMFPGCVITVCPATQLGLPSST
jgi:hypothetical protein